MAWSRALHLFHIKCMFYSTRHILQHNAKVTDSMHPGDLSAQSAGLLQSSLIHCNALRALFGDGLKCIGRCFLKVCSAFLGTWCTISSKTSPCLAPPDGIMKSANPKLVSWGGFHPAPADFHSVSCDLLDFLDLQILGWGVGSCAGPGRQTWRF